MFKEQAIGEEILKTSVVTLARRKQLAKITSGAIASIPKITHIVFGDNGIDPDGNPVEPLDTQIKLNNEIGRYGVGSIEYPTETTVRYTVTIPEADLVGKKLSEMALVDADGNLAAIKNMFPKQKDSDVEFKFEFDDEF